MDQDNIISSCNKMNSLIQRDSFINVFEILTKDLIILYFITSTQYSNYSSELCNLLLCSRYIEKVFRRNFKLRYMYYVYNTKGLNELKYVKNITFGDEFNQPFKKNT